MGATATYNRQHAGKAWEILGYTHDGEVYCVDCGDQRIAEETEAERQFIHPIFATDELDATCAPCGVQVIATLG
jgi:hypothetical protein